MNRALFLILLSPCLLLLSCDDTTDSLGASLIPQEEMYDTTPAEYYVASETVPATKLNARAPFGFLGNMKDPETGSYIGCSYMSQVKAPARLADYQPTVFHGIDSVIVAGQPSRPLTTAADDQAIKQAKLAAVEADSCVFTIYVRQIFGDSTAVMHATIHELATPYEEGNTYTTDYNPKAEGLVRNGGIHEPVAYTPKNLALSASASTSSNYFSVALSKPYTDRDGNTYNNYGTYLMRRYYADPDAFHNTYRFTHEVCPGFFVESTSGLGNVIEVAGTSVTIYYKVHLTTQNVDVVNATIFAGTEETIQRTAVDQTKKNIDALVADNSCTYVKSPAGAFTRLTLPVDEIMGTHESDTLNTARLFVPRLNNVNTVTASTLPTTQTLLMVPADSIDTFFDNKNIADSRITYTASYSLTTNGYTFNNISTLVTSMFRGPRTSEHWNQVLLVPVTVSSSTSSSVTVVTKVTHDMSLSTTRLLRGDTQAKNMPINVIYSKPRQ